MNKNNLLFLSHKYDLNTPAYGGKKGLEIITLSSIKNGDTANSSKWIFNSNHIGTHIDLPFHFNDDGNKIDSYLAKDFLFSRISLIEIPCNKAKLICIDDILTQSIDLDAEILLIKTNYEQYRNSDKYWNDNPGISSLLAEYLIKNYKKLKFIGFDFLSLTSWKHRQEGRKSHMKFLNPDNDKKPICIIEDMSLKNIKSRINWLIICPIRVSGSDGGPVTIIASQS